MGSRGRKSAADLAVVGTTATERPHPPACLTPEMKAEWVLVVNANPADRFGEELLPLLEAHCRHRVALRHVGQLVEEMESREEIPVKDYDRLLKMQERESRCLASLAVRLGFAHTTGKNDPKTPKGSLRRDYDY